MRSWRRRYIFPMKLAAARSEISPGMCHVLRLYRAEANVCESMFALALDIVLMYGLFNPFQRPVFVLANAFYVLFP